MSSEVIIAVIAAIGSSSVVTAIVTALLNRKRNSVEITKVLLEMSKDEVLGTKESNKELRVEVKRLSNEVKNLREVLEELVRTVERDVLPVLPVEHTETRRALRAIASRAKEVV
ncbi:hypothetical protein [Gordonia sp. (in: high G+C Gram-positive bacteria)]|uniref:hypothetical protein n=1 Tax=Gordonia sp. (in: high G+C Gram-positive bacteria) TaxID=84139 RepID=UPI003F99FC63